MQNSKQNKVWSAISPTDEIEIALKMQRPTSHAIVFEDAAKEEMHAKLSPTISRFHKNRAANIVENFKIERSLTRLFLSEEKMRKATNTAVNQATTVAGASLLTGAAAYFFTPIDVLPPALNTLGVGIATMVAVEKLFNIADKKVNTTEGFWYNHALTYGMVQYERVMRKQDKALGKSEAEIKEEKKFRWEIAKALHKAACTRPYHNPYSTVFSAYTPLK